MNLSIESLGADRYAVTVAAVTTTRHTVTVRPEYLRNLGSENASAEALLRESFGFLLEHESNESILSSFDLSVIQRYFPSYESTMRSRFGAA